MSWPYLRSYLSYSVLCAYFVAIALPVAANEKSGAGDYAARYWVSDMSGSRLDYETSLAEMLLKSTEDEFGPYSFERVFIGLSFSRGSREVAQGDAVNFFSNPLPAKSFNADKRLNVIPIPIMKGLLGYRQLVVEKAQLAKFGSIKTYTDLQKYRAGQISSWIDVEIYENNWLPIATGPTFEAIFSMLSYKRYDYLPLGVTEVAQILREQGDKASDFAVVPNIMLYYSLPVFFQVSERHPKLAKRLKTGLEQSFLDGSFDALFNKHFAESLSKLRPDDVRVFQLRNTSISLPYQKSPPLLVRQDKVLLSPAFDQRQQQAKSY